MAVTLMSMKPFSTMLIRYQRNINFDNLTISDTQFCPEHIWGFCRFPSVLGHFVRIYSTYHTVGEDQLHGKGLADHRANALPSGSADFAEEGDGKVWD